MEDDPDDDECGKDRHGDTGGKFLLEGSDEEVCTDDGGEHDKSPFEEEKEDERSQDRTAEQRNPDRGRIVDRQILQHDAPVVGSGYGAREANGYFLEEHGDQGSGDSGDQADGEGEGRIIGGRVWHDDFRGNDKPESGDEKPEEASAHEEEGQAEKDGADGIGEVMRKEGVVWIEEGIGFSHKEAWLQVFRGVCHPIVRGRGNGE